MEIEKIISLAKDLGLSKEEVLKKLEKKRKENAAVSDEEVAEQIKNEHKIDSGDFIEKRLATDVIRRRKIPSKVPDKLPIPSVKEEDIKDKVIQPKIEEAPKEPILKVETEKIDKEEVALDKTIESTPTLAKPEEVIVLKERESQPLAEDRKSQPAMEYLPKKVRPIDEESQRREFEKSREKLEKKIEEFSNKKALRPKKVIKPQEKEAIPVLNKDKTLQEQPASTPAKDDKSAAAPKFLKDKKPPEKAVDEESKDKKKSRKKVKDFKTIFDKRKKLKDVEVVVVEEDSKKLKEKANLKKYKEKKQFDKKISTKPIVKESKKKIKILSNEITVSELAKDLNVKAIELIKKLMLNGITATINNAIDIDTATLIATEYGFEIEKIGNIEEKISAEIKQVDREDELMPRPPVVTIMGHVDHGKTSLLDKIRQTNVTASEAGGITQHIGAYLVDLEGNKITFIDTPGHEAFTAMRARGAKVTDIVVLIVAADDGVMPQTIEAINHSKAANVPIIVAINKIDKNSANPDRILTQLMEHHIVTEQFGGETICIKVSAKTGDGIKELLEAILIQAEILELRANPNKKAKGYIIESKLDKNRGSVATVLVTEGTLKIGDFLVAGNLYCKVRAMSNHLGHKIDAATPATPVEILGFNGVPEAGEVVIAISTEKEAKELIEHRITKDKERELIQKQKISLEDIQKQIMEGAVKELNILVKVDVQGTSDAIRLSLEKLKTSEVSVKIIGTGVGGITESDVLLAQASQAIIIGFNVRPDVKARKLAEKEQIEIKTYSIIYELIDDIRKALEGLLDPEYKEEYHGRAEVRQIFSVPKVGTIAGCYLVDGKITRNSKVRLLRDNIIVFDGELASLKRFKDDVKEVLSGYECGMGLLNFNDVKIGDIIEGYTIAKKIRTL